MHNAILNGYNDVFYYLYSKYGYIETNIYVETSHGHLPIIEFIIKNTDVLEGNDPRIIAEYAVRGDYLPIIQHILENNLLTQDNVNDLLNTAIEYQKMDIIRYLLNPQRYGEDSLPLLKADVHTVKKSSLPILLDSGRLDIIRLLARY